MVAGSEEVFMESWKCYMGYGVAGRRLEIEVDLWCIVIYALCFSQFNDRNELRSFSL